MSSTDGLLLADKKNAKKSIDIFFFNSIFWNGDKPRKNKGQCKRWQKSIEIMVKIMLG